MGSRALAQRASGPAVVPVTVAATDRLHILAHRAGVRARDLEDWWGSPIETALAAVALARHSGAYRSEADRVLQRLLRWWRDERPRRISSDVVALAFAALAAAELRRADSRLTAAAVEALDDLSKRDRSIVPEMHLALAAWALSSLVPDRSGAPWPALRDRLARRELTGVDEAVRCLALGLALDPFEPYRLLQDLLAELTEAPGLSGSAVSLWVISVGCEELTRHLSRDDNALQVLLRRRAELVERIAAEVDEQTFLEPEIEEFDSPREAKVTVVAHLSQFEALLLDLALASRNEATPWLTFAEAEGLFGKAGTAAREETRNVRRRFLTLVGALVSALGVVGGLSLWLGLRALGVESGVRESVAVVLASLILAVAFAIVARGKPDARFPEAVGVFFGLLALLGTAIAGSQLSAKPFISDATGLVLSTLIAAGGMVLWLTLARLVRGRDSVR